MALTEQLAKHFREIHFGGNWTVSNLREHLSDITWQEATTAVSGFNTIAVLAFHINYFVAAALEVLHGRPLTAHDKYSFTHPPINDQQDWQRMLDKMWSDAETFAALLSQFPDDRMWEPFTDVKYGNWYRNMAGIIEHSHYHLGQIVIIKKLVRKQAVS